VRINYRVGILGFIGGTAVDADQNGAISNNGFNDSKGCWVVSGIMMLMISSDCCSQMG
jgi:carboxylesterase type B